LIEVFAGGERLAAVDDDRLAGQPAASIGQKENRGRLNPNLTVKWLTDYAPKIPPLFEGLRKARLPEE
jgi:hypothetical protein